MYGILNVLSDFVKAGQSFTQHKAAKKILIFSCSDMLDITPPALMLTGVEELPLRLNFAIGFQFGIGFCL